MEKKAKNVNMNPKHVTSAAWTFKINFIYQTGTKKPKRKKKQKTVAFVLYSSASKFRRHDKNEKDKALRLQQCMTKEMRLQFKKETAAHKQPNSRECLRSESYHFKVTRFVEEAPLKLWSN